jgi:hypothetical protein
MPRLGCWSLRLCALLVLAGQQQHQHQPQVGFTGAWAATAPARAVAARRESSLDTPYVVYVNQTVLLSDWPDEEADEPRLSVVSAAVNFECTIDTVCSYAIALDRMPPPNVEAQVDVWFERDTTSASTADFFFVVDDPLLPASRRHLRSGTPVREETDGIRTVAVVYVQSLAARYNIRHCLCAVNRSSALLPFLACDARVPLAQSQRNATTPQGCRPTFSMRTTGMRR